MGFRAVVSLPSPQWIPDYEHNYPVENPLGTLGRCYLRACYAPGNVTVIGIGRAVAGTITDAPYVGTYSFVNTNAVRHGSIQLANPTVADVSQYRALATNERWTIPAGMFWLATYFPTIAQRINGYNAASPQTRELFRYIDLGAGGSLPATLGATTDAFGSGLALDASVCLAVQ